MNVTALPLSSSPAPSASSDAATGATSPVDAAKGFAGMMAGVRPQQATKAAPKAKNDTDAHDEDDKSDRAKDDADHEDAASLLALSAQAAPLVATPLPVATNAKSDASTKTNAAVVVATDDAAAPSLSATTTDPQTVTTQASAKADAATMLQALAAASPPETPAVQTTAVQTAAQPTQSLKPTVTSGSTASFLLGRTATKTNASDRAKDTDADDALQVDATTSDTIATPIVATSMASAISPAGASLSDAGQSLAAAGADRQLDLAKDSAWLDGLARDIASTGDSGGTLRFQLSPQQLGNLQVEVKRGDDGAAVTLTTSTSAAQSILNDAKPQLLAEARAHGLHVSDARIDLGSTNTSGQGSDSDARQKSADQNPTSRDTATSNGTGGDTGRQAQQQARAEPDVFPQSPRAVASAPAETSSAVVNASETDARYA